MIGADHIASLPNDAMAVDYPEEELGLGGAYGRDAITAKIEGPHPDRPHALGTAELCGACVTFRRNIGFDESPAGMRMHWVAARRRGRSVLLCGGQIRGSAR